MIAVIIADGDFPKTEYPRYLIKTADILVCCDGAFETFLKESADIFTESKLPDVVIGDMDSLSESIKTKYSNIIQKVDEQENNDLTKAFLYTVENYPDVKFIHILGASGKREDHTIGNMSLLMEYTKRFGEKITIDMISDYSIMFAATNSLSFECGIGRKISLITPDPSLKLISDGLQWPLEGVELSNWWVATLNKATKDRIRIEFSHPSMLLIIMN